MIDELSKERILQGIHAVDIHSEEVRLRIR